MPPKARLCTVPIDSHEWISKPCAKSAPETLCDQQAPRHMARFWRICNGYHRRSMDGHGAHFDLEANICTILFASDYWPICKHGHTLLLLLVWSYTPSICLVWIHSLCWCRCLSKHWIVFVAMMDLMCRINQFRSTCVGWHFVYAVNC